jgi:hypothetical protein
VEFGLILDTALGLILGGEEILYPSQNNAADQQVCPLDVHLVPDQGLPRAEPMPLRPPLREKVKSNLTP